MSDVQPTLAVFSLRSVSWVRVAAALLILAIGPGCKWYCPWCPSDDEGVPVSDVFWRAFTEPETFDDWLRGQQVERGAASCLRSRATRFLNDEQNKLRECSQIVTGSPAWEQCHDDAVGYHNGGVVAQDIASTLDGTARFANTNAGRDLILRKSVLGSALWNQLINELRGLFPRIEC